MSKINQPLFETNAVSKATDQLMSVQTEQTITSLEIAGLTGKEHAHIMRDIRNILSQIDEINQSNFGLISYIDSRNRLNNSNKYVNFVYVKIKAKYYV